MPRRPSVPPRDPNPPARTEAPGPRALRLHAPLAALLLVAPPLGCGATPSAGAEGPPADGVGADLVLVGGRLVTLDPKRPEASALAARGGRIVAVGDDAQIARRIGPRTRVIDLAGRLAVPGFIEGHGHFLGLGDRALQLDLAGARSWDEIVLRVAQAVRAAAPGELIRGRGWHQEKWERPPTPAVEGLPVHDALSAISPQNPVLLTHASGHAVLANAYALKAAGIERTTPDPPGGTIVRGPDGAPIGVLRETAAGLLAPVLEGSPAPSRERRARLAAKACLRAGVTSFQDAGSSFEDVRALRTLAERGELGVRLWVMLREPNERLAAELDDFPWLDLADHHLTVRAIKRAIDGALGSHGAWLLEPYADLPDSSGLETTPVPVIERTAEIALAHGMQLCVHAIGDRANRETLDLFERAFSRAGVDGRALRWRIEHAQHLAPQDVPRFARLGVIASMQPVHCTSDGPWVPQRLGESRARERSYLWRALLDSGALISAGTDTPVEPLDPLANFRAAVTRRMENGERFSPEQAMTREEAFRAMTLWAAYAAFEEDQRGSLAPGKLADIVVLSEDILSCPEERLAAARVDLTIVAGRVRWERPAALGAAAPAR